MTNRHRIAFFAIAIATALSLSACSDGDESSSSTTTTEAPDVATTLSDSPYCQSLQRFNERYGRINPGFGEPAQLRTALEDSSAAIKEAEGTAPPELKADLATLQTGLQQLRTMFEQVGYDVTKLQPTQLDQLQSTPNLTAAAQRVQAYTRDNCL